MSRHLRMALVLTLVLTTTVSLISPAAAGNVPDWQETALNTSLAWLRTQQQADGSFPAAFGSPAGITCDVVLAAASVGQDPATWKASPGGPSAMDYLAGAVGDYATAAAPTGKLIVAVAAAGMDPADFGGHDLPSLLQTFHGGSGYGASAMDQAWAILGLAAIRHQVPVSDVIVLRDYQQANGGWEGAPGWGTDTNTTALAAQALIAAGEPVTSAVISNTLGYLQGQQNDDGGFPYTKPSAWGDDSDANSTAYVIQGLIATGENPSGAAWTKTGGNPVAALLGFQLPSGPFEWQPGMGENLLATAQAIPALAGKPLPLPAVMAARRDALGWLRTAQQDDGSFPSGFGSALSPTAQGVVAIVSAGERAQAWESTNGATPLDFLGTHLDEATEAGTLGRVVMALAASGENPFLFGEQNLRQELMTYYDPDTGSFDAYGNVWNHAIAMWALAASHQTMPAGAVAWLLDQQNTDGGWGWAVDQASDTNSTAVAVQALVGAGVLLDAPAVVAALDFLAGQQNTDGGFPYVKPSPWGTDSDANSTANVFQALLASGEAPTGWDWTTTLTETTAITLTLHNPMDRLLDFQTADGSFQWQPGLPGDFMSTVQAIPALAWTTWPLRGPQAKVALDALAWLRGQVQADGSLPAAIGSPLGITADGVFALVAGGENPDTWGVGGGPTPVDYLKTHAMEADTAGLVAKMILAAVGLRENPRAFGGDMYAQLQGFYDGSGHYGTSAMDQAWALLALAAMQKPIPPEAVAALRDMQLENGGWEASAGWGHDTNTTALAIQALVAAGESAGSEAIQDALTFLEGQQNDDGGFPYTKPSAWGTDSDANSTAYVVQGLVAAGEDPAGPRWTQSGGKPLEALAGFQVGSGAFEWQPGMGESVLATAQAVPAILRTSQPFVHAQTPGWLCLPLTFKVGTP